MCSFKQLQLVLFVLLISIEGPPSAQARPDEARPINDDDMLPECCHRSLMGSMQMMMMMEYKYARSS